MEQLRNQEQVHPDSTARTNIFNPTLTVIVVGTVAGMMMGEGKNTQSKLLDTLYDGYKLIIQMKLV